MARRSKRRLLVQGAEHGMQTLKADVMRQEGFAVDSNRPDDVKTEVARSLGVKLEPGYNGSLRTEDAGRIGGRIGGPMVREMIRMAQEKLTRQP